MKLAVLDGALSSGSHGGEAVPDVTGNEDTDEEVTGVKVTDDVVTGVKVTDDVVTGVEATGVKIPADETTLQEMNEEDFGQRLNEETYIDLASQLQGTVEFLEVRENQSREKVITLDDTARREDDTARREDDTARREDDPARKMGDTDRKVDEAGRNNKKPWNWDSGPPCRIFKGPRRAWKGVMTSMPPKLLRLLLLSSLLGVGATSRVQGGGRAEQGKAYSLTCVVQDLPSMNTTHSYLWYKDGDIIRKETKQVLTFTRLTQEDAGMYQCGPKRPPRLGFLLSEPTELRVLDASVDQDILYCRLNTAPADFSWTIPAHAMDSEVVVVSPKGEELFTWTRDLPPLDEFTFWDRAENVQVEGANIRFSLSEVWPADDGHYSCRERSVTGPVIPDCGQTLHYITIPQPGAPQTELTVEGQRGVLVCLGRFPLHYFNLGLDLYYEWFKDGQLLPGQRASHLVLDPAQQSDSGWYTCRVREATRNCYASPDSKGNWLQVSVPPRVRVQGQDKDSILKVPEGEKLTLTCDVEAAFPHVPPNGFSWTFSPSDSSPAQQLPETGDTLTLGPLTREDSGQYTCQARNDQNFRGRIPPGHDSITVAVLYLEKMQLTPADVQVKEGENFTLTCSVESSPTAHLQWMVDGVLRREVTANVDFYNVLQAAPGDAGNYACRATNSDKLQRSAWTTVTVIDLEKMQLTPADVQVKEGENFTLTCRVESSPTAHLRWMVDGVLRREVTANVDFYNVLRAAPGDAGNYTCRATNSDKLQRSAWTMVTVIGGGNYASSSSLLVLLPTVLVLLLQ